MEIMITFKDCNKVNQITSITQGHPDNAMKLIRIKASKYVIDAPIEIKIKLYGSMYDE